MNEVQERLVREEVSKMSPRIAATTLRKLSRYGFHESVAMVALADRALEATDLARSERAALEKYRATYAAGRKVQHKSGHDYPTEEDQS